MFMSFISLSQYTAFTPINSKNRLVFVMGKQCIFCMKEMNYAHKQISHSPFCVLQLNYCNFNLQMHTILQHTSSVFRPHWPIISEHTIVQKSCKCFVWWTLIKLCAFMRLNCNSMYINFMFKRVNPSHSNLHHAIGRKCKPVKHDVNTRLKALDISFFQKLIVISTSWL